MGPVHGRRDELDGWVLLERTSLYRARGKTPFLGQDPTVGQALLESEELLTQQVLKDHRIAIYACGRRDIQAGEIDQRVLALLEFMRASGLDPTVSALKCGHSLLTTSGNVSDNASGDAVDIAAINGIPIAGHQGAGSVTDIRIRRLIDLEGTYKPYQIISLMALPGTDNTFALPDHGDRVHVGFMPAYNSDPRLRRQVDSVLKPSQWIKLIGRLDQISPPQNPAQPSRAAVPDKLSAPGK